jgi:hypothetical protein
MRLCDPGERGDLWGQLRDGSRARRANHSDFGTTTPEAPSQLAMTQAPMLMLAQSAGAFAHDGLDRLRAIAWNVHMSDYRLDMYGNNLAAGDVTIYERDGSVVAGPATSAGWPYLIGADGTIYTYFHANIAAYSRDLKMLWHWSAPAPSGTLYGAVLDRSGVLYLATDGSTGTVLTALQTRSPGLARSAWPAHRHDNRGTAWLDQAAQDPELADGGAD